MSPQRRKLPHIHYSQERDDKSRPLYRVTNGKTQYLHVCSKCGRFWYAETMLHLTNAQLPRQTKCQTCFLELMRNPDGGPVSV